MKLKLTLKGRSSFTKLKCFLFLFLFLINKIQKPLMTSYIIEPLVARRQNNITFITIILFFAIPIIVAMSNISLFYIILIVLVINITYPMKTVPVPIGVPIAKVIWTQEWEDECIRRNTRLPPNASSSTFQVRNYANSWDEIHVRYLENTNTSLYNYNTIDPIRGDPLNPPATL